MQGDVWYEISSSVLFFGFKPWVNMSLIIELSVGPTKKFDIQRHYNKLLYINTYIE